MVGALFVSVIMGSVPLYTVLVKTVALALLYMCLLLSFQ
jgi:hypothetical protein